MCRMSITAAMENIGGGVGTLVEDVELGASDNNEAVEPSSSPIVSSTPLVGSFTYRIIIIPCRNVKTPNKIKDVRQLMMGAI
mmetsp:Transcript_12457/g.18835  ORF Transcript_12457/g.18835 Transcript_12457/m.18835 type:complete len:82 (-) Transcript_12457:634-879(-)